MYTVSHAAALSVSLAHGCVSSTGSWQGETWLHNHYWDGRWSLDNNRLPERLAAACVECSRHVHWSMTSSPWCLRLGLRSITRSRENHRQV